MPGTNVTMKLWDTIKNWSIKGRPATEKKTGNKWVGLPGSENPKPGYKYRIAIVWGPVMRVSDTETKLDRVVLRVVFDGWRYGDSLKYKDSIQFFQDESFNTPLPSNRVHVELGDTLFLPRHADTVAYAYFQVKEERTRAWKMKYNIGLYGWLYSRTWKKVTAR